MQQNENAGCQIDQEADRREKKQAQATTGLFEKLMLVLIAAAAGAIGAYFMMQHLSPPGQQDYPIALVDVQAHVQAAMKRTDLPAGRSAVDEGLHQVKVLASRLADNGYLVLEVNSVLAAPQRFYVSMPEPEEVGDVPTN